MLRSPIFVAAGPWRTSVFFETPQYSAASSTERPRFGRLIGRADMSAALLLAPPLGRRGRVLLARLDRRDEDRAELLTGLLHHVGHIPTVDANLREPIEK